ncbi:cell division protein FtsQ/DivIB [Candidatus Ichthyocystis hellenicum]|uniref:cell division protein FtsQ/DivIB n=1 Tax=Candidatus Ichthyocystis hellenicum TaxID=1561003 RepID=UPI000B834854|nr:cell division protein FtsQ/DivIB [Candidatus Ichthyocystis hellenicum]
MWDKPSWLNQIAAVLVVLSFITYLTAAWSWVKRQSSFSIDQVLIQGYWHHIDLNQLREVAINSICGNFFGIDLDRLRYSFELIPWVSHVTVKRLWPWRIFITLYEHVPAVRWGKDRLISREGVLFSGTVDGDFPVLLGPEGTHQEMLLAYGQLEEILSPIHINISKLHLSPTYSWEIVLKSGMVIRVGSDFKQDRAISRVRRFAESYKILNVDKNEIRSVDLRYPNGFSVSFSEKYGRMLLKRGYG